jgi:putative chitinase
MASKVPEECEIITKYYKRNNMSVITLELLQKICPKTKASVLQQYVEPLNEVCQYYEINTPKRIAGFLAQTAHESGGFTAVKENLNYSAKGLMTTFKKYFPTEALAKEYERQPAKIANKVYGNRMGNGDEASGDGSRYCGRGLIQLTGKQNYTRFAADLGISIEECVAYMETPAGAVSSAGWFFDQNDLLKYCDSGDILNLTKRINGGTIGLEDRIHHYELALKVLGE